MTEEKNIRPKRKKEGPRAARPAPSMGEIERIFDDFAEWGLFIFGKGFTDTGQSPHLMRAMEKDGGMLDDKILDNLVEYGIFRVVAISKNGRKKYELTELGRSPHMKWMQ
jgi:hypothetical protein